MSVYAILTVYDLGYWVGGAGWCLGRKPLFPKSTGLYLIRARGSRSEGLAGHQSIRYFRVVDSIASNRIVYGKAALTIWMLLNGSGRLGK